MLKRLSAKTRTHLSFATTIFVGATLLFSCQPMIARMIVPLLGGAPAVWIVCSLCFQALLLAGYGYAHFVTTRLPVRGQVALQLVLVASVFLVMPVGVDEGNVERFTAGHPTLGLLFVLLRSIGLPFFVLSTSSPLIQRWFAELGERDPYHLYAASNAGSMMALFGYPLVVEPLLTVRGQSRALHAGYAVYTVLLVGCAAAAAMRRPAGVRLETTPAPPQVHVSDSAFPAKPKTPSSQAGLWRERFVWIALSFAPSSLLLGATEYVTTDIASVPLLWVVPLALYLMSFIVAFSKRQPIAPATWSRLFALTAAVVAAITLVDVTRYAGLVICAHMLLLFLASVVCHRALALRRPRVERLTEFYLLLSIGGVLGGAFNGLLAPILFDDLFEYPIAIALACIGRAALDPNVTKDRNAIIKDVAIGTAVGLVTYGLVQLGDSGRVDTRASFGWMFGVPIVFALLWSNHAVRYAVAVGGILLAGMTHGGDLGTTLWADRGFFGVLKVTRDRESRYRLLVSGRTLAGKQAIDPARARVPLAYYHPSGPAGDVLGGAGPARTIGVIGLGIGSLAAYAHEGDAWTFFEINPTVVDVARKQFTYLEMAEQIAKVQVEVGDARLRLRQGEPARFDALVLDAFSSDAVPIHLVTREALAVYRRALRPGGLLLAHVTNEHVQLAPVFAALARDAGLIAITRRDPGAEDGKSPSEWVLLSDAKGELDFVLRARPDWHALTAPPSQSVWTDDYANVLRSLRF
jgi:SAM-dependent methyltransferase